MIYDYDEYRKKLRQIQLIFFLIFILTTIFLGPRIYFHSQHFKKTIQDNFAFISGTDNARFVIDSVKNKGLFSVLLIGVNIVHLSDESKSLLYFESISVSPSLKLRPLSIRYKFFAKVNEERSISGTFTSPIFDGLTPFKRQSNTEASPGDLYVSLDHIPLSFLLNLYKGKFPVEYVQSISGLATGQVVIVKKFPYSIDRTRMTLAVTLDPVEIQFGHNQKLPLNPIQVRWNLEGGLLQNPDQLQVSSPQIKGRVNADIGLSLDEKYSLSTLVNFSGESDLFWYVKKFLHCPLEKTNVTVQGFRTLTCS